MLRQLILYSEIHQVQSSVARDSPFVVLMPHLREPRGQQMIDFFVVIAHSEFPRDALSQEQP